MDIETARAQGERNFREGFNCAQSVLLVFCDELGVAHDIAMKLAQPFGGGTCRMREMCGTVAGMLMALGFLEGDVNPKDKAAKDEIYRHGQQLVKKFTDANGSYVCRELLGLAPVAGTQKFLRENSVSGDSLSPVSEVRTESYYKKRPCPRLCGCSAAIFAEYLNKRNGGNFR